MVGGGTVGRENKLRCGGKAVPVVVASTGTGDGRDAGICVFHGNSKACASDHLEVVEAVTHRRNFRGVDPIVGAERFNRCPLVDISTKRLEEVRGGAGRGLSGEGGPMLYKNLIPKLLSKALDDRLKQRAVGDRTGPHRVAVVGVFGDRHDPPIGHREMVKPPFGRRIEGMVADHHVVETGLRVVLEKLREVTVLSENFADCAREFGRETSADNDRTIARIMDQRAPGGDRVASVIDEVEHVSALAQGAAGGGNDFHARILQSADRREVALADLSLAVEERSVEVGDKESKARHAAMVARDWLAAVGRARLYNCVVPVANQPTFLTPLHAADGLVLMDACDAIVKGALESQVPVEVIAAPMVTRFAGLSRIAQSEPAQRLLARHQTEFHLGGDGARAVSLALGAMRGGRSAIALVPASDLVAAVAALRGARASFMSPGHGVALILEDDPDGAPMLCPRRLAIDAGLPIVEPTDLSSLRDAVEQSLRLSRAGVVPVAIVVHRLLLAASETLQARPNRVVTSVDELILQRKSRAGLGVADVGDLLRVARRLELNVAVSLPSPGEREVVGFIAIGACERALVDVLGELGLTGRVPVLRLGLISPIDESALQRFLDRVQHAVVLEPRPGSVAGVVLAAADQMRRRSARVPTISFHELPTAPGKAAEFLRLNDATRPSVLVRRIVHLLHAVRPSLSVATKLLSADEALESIQLPSRGEDIGVDAAMRLARQMLVEIDQELRARPELPESEPRPRILVIDALPPRIDAQSFVVAEIYPRERFLLEGPEVVRQAARDPFRRLIIAVDVGGAGEVDLARLADAAIPAGAAARTRVVRVDLNDRIAVRERILSEILGDGVTILVLSDGPPARLDAESIERTFVERDRLGYLPQQRLVWSADIACELRPPALAGLLDDAEEQGSTPIQGSFTNEELGMRVENMQFRAIALSEQVEVVRTKPPMTAYSRGSAGIMPPRPIHAESGTYRVHLAGCRGLVPGVVARVLSDAGRAMGYRVEVLSSDDPCGRGRRAWAQVLWVRARPGDTRAPRTAMIPYGEADLVLGADAVETLRALGPDPALRVAGPARTSVVANDGPLEDQFDDARLEACAMLEGVVERCAQATYSSVDDYASLCRTNLLSERLLDVAMLGVAFQRGLIPVSQEAIEGAVRRAEIAGFGRSFEAFTFGRRLEAGAVVRRTVEEREPVERLVRRLALELVRERFGGRRRAERYALSASGMLASFARLGDGDDVDRATRAVVTALHRAIVWGGTRMMRQYESLIAALLRADPSGELALVAVEPLADAILVRDILYVLSMSTSLEQRRRIRERLGVRASHGDTLERRFLSRFELLIGTRRFRLDFRSSDWPAEIVRLTRPLVPWAIRGDLRAREVRAYAISLAERAASGFDRDSAQWSMCMRRFAMLATDGGLRSLTAAELRASVEGL